MIEFYSEIRFTHIFAVVASGTLFFLRGLGLFAGQRWPLSTPVRMTVYTVDTVLLTAALMLTTIVQQYPFIDGWLTAKVALLLLYIVLGYMAYWSGRPKSVRLSFWIAALAVFGFIVAVALSRHPLAFLGALAS